MTATSATQERRKQATDQNAIRPFRVFATVRDAIWAETLQATISVKAASLAATRASAQNDCTRRS